MYLYILHIFPQEKIMDKSSFLKITKLKSAGICIEQSMDFISTIHSDSRGCKVSPKPTRILPNCTSLKQEINPCANSSSMYMSWATSLSELVR